MATANAVEVTLRARNEASGAFDNFGRDVRTMTQSLRTFGGAIASEINPALGQLLTAMSQVGREVRGFGLGLAGLGITAAAAAVGIATFIGKMNEATERTVNFEHAVKSLNFGSVVNQIDQAAKSLEAFDKSLLGTLLNFTRTPGAYNVLDKIFGREQLQTFMGEARQGFAKALPFENERQRQEFLAKQAETIKQLKTLEAERYSQTNNLEQYLKTQQAIEKAIVNQYAAEEDLARLRNQQREATAGARYGGALPGEVDASRAQLERDLTDITQRYNLALQQASTRREAGAIDIAERLGLQEAARMSRLGPDTGQYITEAEAAELGRQFRQEDLQIQRERVSIQRDIYGLTESQRAAIELQVIQAEKLLKIEEAGGNIRKENLAIAEAEVKTASVLAQERERTDLMAGVARGFKDLERGAGDIGRDFGRSFGYGASRAIDDTLFSVLTGRAKDIGKNIGLSMLRSFTGAVGEFATQPLIRGLSNALGGGYRGLVSVPVAGGGVMLVPGGASALTGGTGVSVGGAGGYTAGIGAAQSTGSPILDLAVGGVGAISQTLGYSFGAAGAAESGALLTAFGAEGASALGAISPELTQTAYAGVAGAGYGSLLGPVAAGVGFLASIYGAYQTQSPGYGALSGAVGGLTAGAVIGSAFPGYGTLIGAAVGLIAGAALGGGAGALGGKNARRKNDAHAQSAREAATAAGLFSTYLGRVQSGTELLQVLNNQWAPHQELRIVAPGRDPLSGNPFTYADLFDPAIVGNLEVLVGPTGYTTQNFDLTMALQEKVRQISGIEGRITAAYQETGPGLTRTTYTPFAALARNPFGAQFYFSSEAARAGGASDVQVLSVMREIQKVNFNTDYLTDLTAERYLNI